MRPVRDHSEEKYWVAEFRQEGGGAWHIAIARYPMTKKQQTDALRLRWGERTVRSSGQCFSGDTRADVDCPKIWVECKVGQRPNIRAALKQAKEARDSSESSKLCVAVCKWDREDPIVTMSLTEFIEILLLAYNPTK